MSHSRLEQRSVVVWEEGEAMHQLPCSQFSLVVEWEGSSGSSVCVDHCTRQNIHVVSFTVPSPNAGQFLRAQLLTLQQNLHTLFNICHSLILNFLLIIFIAGDKESATRDETRDQQEGKGRINISNRSEISGGIRCNRSSGQRDSLTVVASNSVTANNELHYILTSMFDINLVERNAR